jgi:hypothetical protein
MHKILMNVAVVSLGLGISLAAQAASHSRSSGHKSSPSHGRSYHKGSMAHHAPEHKTGPKHPSTSKPHNPHKPKTDGGSKYKSFSHDLIKKHNGAMKHVSKHVADKDYHKKYGKRFRFKVDGKYRTAWYYPGRYHRHWKFYSYNSYYKKWLFYDDCTSTYYYYCGRCSCYRPIEYVCQPCLATPDDPNVDPCAGSDDGVEEEPDCCGN